MRQHYKNILQRIQLRNLIHRLSRLYQRRERPHRKLEKGFPPVIPWSLPPYQSQQGIFFLGTP